MTKNIVAPVSVASTLSKNTIVIRTPTTPKKRNPISGSMFGSPILKLSFIWVSVHEKLTANVLRLGEGGDFTTIVHTKHRTATFAKPLL